MIFHFLKCFGMGCLIWIGIIISLWIVSMVVPDDDPLDKFLKRHPVVSTIGRVIGYSVMFIAAIMLTYLLGCQFLNGK